MAYCKDCGMKAPKGAQRCPVCGGPLTDSDQSAAPARGIDWFWMIPGILYPIVGVCLGVLWRNSKPHASKCALIGAAVGAVLALILYLIDL